MKPTQERLKKEWRSIYKGWIKRGSLKDEVSPVMRLARKYKIPCQEVFEILDIKYRWMNKPPEFRVKSSSRNSGDRMSFS